MNNVNIHGGDLDIISRQYNIPKEDIINFGGNVNPLGLPPSVKRIIIENADSVINYPDVNYVNLRKAISAYTSISPDNITVGNGSTELISGFIKALSPKNSIIVSPAYSEYLKELKQVNSNIELLELKEANNFKLDISQINFDDNLDLIVICNPNNPTGSYVTLEETEEILVNCKKHNTFLMIDETYVEFSKPEKHVSAMPLIEKYDNLFIIRGTSKFFSCPGLRLGYSACSNKELMDIVNSKKDPWSVNTLAELSGCVMFTDKDFIHQTINLINTERDYIFNELSKINNIMLFNTQSNFILAKILKEDITSDYVFEEMIKENMLIRDAKDFPFLNNKFIRFCILDRESNTKLINKLKNILK